MAIKERMSGNEAVSYAIKQIIIAGRYVRHIDGLHHQRFGRNPAKGI